MMKWFRGNSVRSDLAGQPGQRPPLDDTTLKAALDTIFQAMFRRAPDDAALNYHLERYKTGSDLGQLILELAASEEYKKIGRAHV